MKVNYNKLSMGPASINANCPMSCPFSALRKILVKTIVPTKELLNSRKFSVREKTWNYVCNINAEGSICCTNDLKKQRASVTINKEHERTVPDEAYLKPRTRMNYIYVSNTKQNKTMQLQVMWEQTQYHCAWACAPSYIVAYNYTWMGIRIRGDVPEEQSWALPCFFFSKHFKFFKHFSTLLTCDQSSASSTSLH